MVVEDDETICDLSHRVLTRAGYTVLSASGAREAVDVWRKYGKPVHVLVTDVVMPGWSGVELANQFRGLGVDARVLFTSGYSDPGTTNAVRSFPGAAFLEKPFTPEALLRVVRNLLDGKYRSEWSN
jgi:DNA-binding NtrC family response regulator